AYVGDFRNFFEHRVIPVYVLLHLACYGYAMGPAHLAVIRGEKEVTQYLSSSLPGIGGFTALNGHWAFYRTSRSEYYVLSIAV
ncbi:hypothetical protein AAVH_36157, partial [Aphelenchoides avenae]